MEESLEYYNIKFNLIELLDKIIIPETIESEQSQAMWDNSF